MTPEQLAQEESWEAEKQVTMARHLLDTLDSDGIKEWLKNRKSRRYAAVMRERLVQEYRLRNSK